jgi:hypothetical protein
MTAVTHSAYDFLRAVGSIGYQDSEEPDGLFLVTLRSLAGVALTAQTIWRGSGGQLEPHIGLG